MPAQEILTFIKNARASHMAENVITKSLLQNGWTETDVHEALEALTLNPQASEVLPVPIEQPESFWPLKRLLNTTFAIYKRRLIPIHVTIFISTCLTLLPILVFSYISTLSPIAIKFTEPSLSLGSILTYLTLIGLAILGMHWGQSTLAHAVCGDSEITDVKTVLLRGTKYLFSSSILQSLQLFFQLGSTLALVIPGIVFSTWFVFTPFVAAGEKLYGIAALQKSKTYVQGYFWQIFNRLILFWIVTLIPLVLIASLISLASETDATVVLFFFMLLFILYLAVLSIYECFAYAIYTNMIDIKQTEAPQTVGSPFVYVAVSICGLLVSIFLFILSGFLEIGTDKYGRFNNARDVTSQANVLTLKEGLNAYYKDVGYYPTSISLLIPTYIPNAITDPNTDKPYMYTQLDEGSNFRLCLPSGKDCVSETSTTKPLPKLK